MEFYKYPSILGIYGFYDDFKSKIQFVKKDENGVVYDETIPLPTVSLTGTTKLHGTNASIVCLLKEDECTYYPQSRNKIISVDSDNCGFAKWSTDKKEHFKEYTMNILEKNKGFDGVVFYGEWCGEKIQKGVAISQLPRMFILFDVLLVNTLDGQSSKWLKVDEWNFQNPEHQIFSVQNYPQFNVELDFNLFKENEHRLIEHMESVVSQCPVAKEFGVSGTGEGVVYTFWYNGCPFKFKVKEDSKQYIIAKDCKQLALQCCPEWRLEQMYQETFDTLNGGVGTMKKLKQFNKAMYQDIVKEETHRFKDTPYEPVQCKQYIQDISSTWMKNKVKKTH